MPRTGIEPVTRGFSVLCSTNWAIWAFVIFTFVKTWVAGTGFEPMTFGLWARRASRLLHPAILCCIWYVFLFKNIPEKENGWRWIRTTEANCSRFTVCPLWPLGNPSIKILYWQKSKADDRTRTDNLLITNQLLCQLSHIGIFNWYIIKWDLQGSNLWPSACKADALPAELRSHIVIVKTITETTQTGLEPVTSAVTGRRSNQLSH